MSILDNIHAGRTTNQLPRPIERSDAFTPQSQILSQTRPGGGKITPPRGGIQGVNGPSIPSGEREGSAELTQRNPVLVKGDRLGRYEMGVMTRPGSEADYRGVSPSRVASEASARVQTPTLKRHPLFVDRFGNPNERMIKAYPNVGGRAAQEMANKQDAYDQTLSENQVRTAQFKALGADGVTYGGNVYREDQPVPSKEALVRERLNLGTLAAPRKR